MAQRAKMTIVAALVLAIGTVASSATTATKPDMTPATRWVRCFSICWAPPPSSTPISFGHALVRANGHRPRQGQVGRHAAQALRKAQNAICNSLAIVLR